MHDLVRRFDQSLVLLAGKLPRGLEPIMRAATFIGLPAVIMSLAAVIAIVSYFKGKYRIAIAQVASVVALGIDSIIKLIVHRDRPHTMYAKNMKIRSYSFPSGHALGAVAFYGLLAYLAYHYLPQPWNVIILALLIVMIILIGVSRVFLGAHFPSDVLGGWLLGGVFLLLIIKFIKP